MASTIAGGSFLYRANLSEIRYGAHVNESAMACEGSHSMIYSQVRQRLVIAGTLVDGERNGAASAQNTAI